MQIRSKVAAAIGAAVVLASPVVTAAPASAAGPCGSGYSRVGSYSVMDGGTRRGTLEVHYNAGTGVNCALTYGYGSYYGAETLKRVSVSRTDQPGYYDADEGFYKYYAGPVYVHANGWCINLSAQAGVATRTLTGVHCG
ncbi:spore-associated protein A [Nonomuraea sp. NPDC002799]